MDSIKALLQFISNSPTAFHAVESVTKQLDENGFLCLKESESWDLTPGKGYYVTRNQSSIIAFRMPTDSPKRFMITASHTDSPNFKLKANHVMDEKNGYIRLNTEVYGGTILSSWCDRPLSLAGRVILAQNGAFTAKNVNIDRDLLVIPNVCIHQNRNINAGYTYNSAVDMIPLLAQKGDRETSVKNLVAKELGCDPADIAEMELFVYSRTPSTVWGASKEFFSAPRIDNLMCAYATLRGFLQAPAQADSITVYYAADNEETGSSTKQGAASVMLSDTLERIAKATNSDKMQLLASSMMLSADNAHAIHPNHPELSDAQNAPRMNAGVVIKNNAAQKYATDAISSALFAKICQKSSVPYQYYSNRSDMPGGSTLGSIANTKVPLITVDIGLAQLAMHSAYETAGVYDTKYLIDATAQFYETQILADGDGSYRILFND
ncbi:MAG: M18 family aminopeptidase [Clostridia bacterium]|nr:M18 family aminopeptidase [Clostridia bacterium]